jgi:DNA repair protein RecO (recombination protein O)
VTRASTSAGSVVSTRALVLRRVPYGDADLVIELFSETVGRLAALARGARKSQKRFGGTLEPFHTLRTSFQERRGRDLASLREASIVTSRRDLISRLDSMQAAGRVLGWIRSACPPHTPEPRVWRLAEQMLDRLDAAPASVDPRATLGEAGLMLIDALGWGLSFDRCVVCEKACAPGRAAWMHPGRGGLVCQRCGGGQVLLGGATRGRLGRAAQGEWGGLEPGDVDAALELVEAALLTHAGLG